MHSGSYQTHLKTFFYPRVNVNIQSVLKANSSFQKRVKMKGTQVLMISFRKTNLNLLFFTMMVS